MIRGPHTPKRRADAGGSRVIGFIRCSLASTLMLVAGACSGDGGGSEPSVPLRFLYASAYSENAGVFSGAIYAFSVDSNGAITPVAGSPFAPTTNGAPIAITRDSKFLYSVDSATGKLSAFAIQSNGWLTDVPGTPFTTPETPVQLATHPTSDVLYASSETGNVMVFAIDPATGEVSLTSSFKTGDFAIEDAAMTSDGRYFYQTSLWQISGLLPNASTGALLGAVPGSPFKTYSTPGAIGIHPTGKFLYVANSDTVLGYGGSLLAYLIDATSGALTDLPESPFEVGGIQVGVAVDASGRFLIVGTAGKLSGNCMAVLSINPQTGALTPVAGSPFGQMCGVVAADPSGSYVYVGGSGGYTVQQNPGGIFVYSMDQATGALSPIGGVPLAGMQVSTIVLTQ